MNNDRKACQKQQNNNKQKNKLNEPPMHCVGLTNPCFSNQCCCCSTVVVAVGGVVVIVIVVVAVQYKHTQHSTTRISLGGTKYDLTNPGSVSTYTDPNFFVRSIFVT